MFRMKVHAAVPIDRFTGLWLGTDTGLQSPCIMERSVKSLLESATGCALDSKESLGNLRAFLEDPRCVDRINARPFRLYLHSYCVICEYIVVSIYLFPLGLSQCGRAGR